MILTPHPLFKFIDFDFPDLVQNVNAASLGGVYSFEGSGAGIMYVGQTERFRTRILTHLRSAIYSNYVRSEFYKWLRDQYNSEQPVLVSLLDLDCEKEAYYTELLKPKFSNINHAIGWIG